MMKNQAVILYKKTVKMVAMATIFVCPVLAYADNCPLANEVMDHATKEGIGAQWQTGDKLKWYLDYFSNNNKPPATASSKFTFMQASFENQQLTCYYQWPNDDGKTTNWTTVRLRTTDKIKPSWTGVVCQNFEAVNCQFTFANGVGGAAQTTAPTTPSESAAQPTQTPTLAPAPTQTPPPGGGAQMPPPAEAQTSPPAPGDEQLPKAPGDLVVPVVP